MAELLIALAILGVIATFTIPKVLQSQQDSKFNAAAKEAVSAMSQAYQTHVYKGRLTVTSQSRHLIQYLNYLRTDSSGMTIDSYYGGGSAVCDSTRPCVILHNGGVIRTNDIQMGGSSTSNVLFFTFDPDGLNDGTPTGQGKAVEFFILMNGRIISNSSGTAVCQAINCPHGTVPTRDPPWFSWN